MMKMFDKFKMADLMLLNRIVMAPMTRVRAGEKRVPNDMMAEYYTQRTTAELIITEATTIFGQ